MSTSSFQQAAQYRFSKRWMIAKSALALILLVIFAVLAFPKFHREFVAQHATVDVWFNDLRGLTVGSLVEESGDVIGRVVEIKRGERENARRVRIELLDDPWVVEQVQKSGTNFYIDTVEIEQMEVRGENRAIQGPVVIVKLGDKNAPLQKEFEGISARPLHPALEWSGIEIEVNCQFAYKLGTYSRVVNERRIQVGVVKSVSQDGLVKAVLFDVDEAKCPYTKKHTRYYVNQAALVYGSTEGDAHTVLYGTELVAVPDLFEAKDEVCLKFDCKTDRIPHYLPEKGEKKIFLSSKEWYPADTPLRVLGGRVAGYLHSQRQLRDGSGYFLEVRVYSWAQNLITRNAKFARKQPFKTQWFKKKNPSANPLDLDSWEPPRIDITSPQTLIWPEIELWTPEDNPGAKHNFQAGEESAFELHERPEKDWQNWQAALPIYEGGEKQPEKLPITLRTKLSWRTSFSFQKEQVGLALPHKQGVIALKGLLRPPVQVDKLQSQNLLVEEKEFQPATLVDLNEDLQLMQLQVDPQITWSEFAIVDRVVDVLVMVDRQNPRAIDRQRLRLAKPGFKVSPDVPHRAYWHGAPVISLDPASFGKVIGFFKTKEEGGAEIVFLPSDFVKI